MSATLNELAVAVPQGACYTAPQGTGHHIRLSLISSARRHHLCSSTTANAANEEGGGRPAHAAAMTGPRRSQHHITPTRAL